MVSEKVIVQTKKRIKGFFRKTCIVVTEEELRKIEVTDFGLSDFYNIGLSVVIYINTSRVCAKELALLPFQICPQHKHPDIANKSGKEETFRCRWGVVYLYVEGDKSVNIKASIPKKYSDKISVFHEILLKPGDQFTLQPNTWHWFQGGPEGAVVSEFSTHSCDDGDIFYDKDIERIPVDN